MRDVFLYHIYLMYSIWFGCGLMLLAYIAYRRKRIALGHSPLMSSKQDTSAAH